LESAISAKPYTLIMVRMPNELHDVLDALAQEKGETLSVIVRDLVRAAAPAARRVDLGIPRIIASAGRAADPSP
jgi:predicted DNA-binding protein